MKTTILFIIVLWAGTFTHAQQKETKTVYYFGMSVLQDKNFAVTPVITSTILATNQEGACTAQLRSYLTDYIPAETNYKIDWTNQNTATSTLSGSTHADAERFRLQSIKQMKDYGYNIVHLNAISFSCDQ